MEENLHIGAALSSDSTASTLYVSDLDGTLMHKDLTISDFTVNTINELVNKGMHFSFATARSLVTASKIASKIEVSLPVIVYNGSFIMDSRTGEVLSAVFFSKEERQKIGKCLLEHDVYPIVYAFRDGIEKYSYVPELISRASSEFLQEKKGDIRDNPVPDTESLMEGEIFYFTCIDEEEKLAPLYEAMKDTFYCVYQRDIYSGEQWLEIMPKQATKANAVKRLMQMLGCSRIISFGDGKNDIPMFQISDECYAMENAEDALKRIATAVIGSNEEDGVAKWLQQNFKQDQIHI